MKRVSSCFILVLLLIFVGAENLDKQRIELKPRSFYKNIERDESKKVNPRSFYYNKHTKEENAPNIDVLYVKLETKGHLTDNNDNKTLKQKSWKNGVKEKEIYKLHYHRLINMLLQNIYIEQNDKIGFIEGTIGIRATLEEWEILQNVESQNIPLKEVDEILSKVLHQPGQSLYAKTLINLSFISHFVYEHQYILYLVIAFLTAMFVIIKCCTTKSTAVTFIILCIVSISWYITHDDMMKEVMIRQKTYEMVYKVMPSSCTPQTMKPWYEKMWPLDVLFSQSNIEDCRMYVQTNLVTPLTEVTLLMSFSRMMSRCIFEPLSVYGQTLNIFLANLTNGMHWSKKLLVEAIIYISQICIIILVVIKIFYGSISIFIPFCRITLQAAQPVTVPTRIEAVEHNHNVPLQEPSTPGRMETLEHNRNVPLQGASTHVQPRHSKAKKAVKQPSIPKNDTSCKESDSNCDSDEADSSNTKECDSAAKCGFKTNMSLNNSHDEKQIISDNTNNDISGSN